RSRTRTRSGWSWPPDSPPRPVAPAGAAAARGGGRPPGPSPPLARRGGPGGRAPGGGAGGGGVGGRGWRPARLSLHPRCRNGGCREREKHKELLPHPDSSPCYESVGTLHGCKHTWAARAASIGFFGEHPVVQNAA